MVTRLVLGCGTIGHAVVTELTERRGETFVLDPDASRVESLRNEKIAAEVVDVTDPAELRAVDRDPDVVFVAADDPETNLAAARAAREVFPGGHLVAYTGDDASRARRDDVAAVADEVVHAPFPVVETVERAVAAGDDRRVRRLRSVVQSVGGTLGIFTHDNPDPDAIAAAVALARIAERLGVAAEPCYFGDVSHQENRAFVNLLDLDLRNVDPGEDLDYAGYALVDHSRPGVNDQLDPATPIDVVIDHHPPKGEVDGRFVDVREDVGATSTLLAEYLQQFEVELDRSVATALLYGIRVDTKDFSREITTADFEAAADLLPTADVDVLERVEAPSVSAETLDVIARAIQERRLVGSTLASCVGAIADRDSLAQAADRLLTMEGVTVTFVYGFMDGTVYASARARGNDVDLGEVLRRAFDEMGSAGGHADMAGAQIPLGIFDVVEVEAESTLTEMLEDAVGDRFFATMREVGAGRRASSGLPDESTPGAFAERGSDGGADANGATETGATDESDDAGE